MDRREAGGNGELASLRTTSVTKLDRVVVRFAGDSGDGMQLTGDRFTSEASAFGNELATLPNFPAEIHNANVLAFGAGWNYGETTESFTVTYDLPAAEFPPGTYRQITGNLALAYGLVAAGQCAKLPVLLGSYPITPASDILHELSRHKNFDITTMQAEDEIAGVGAALGAAYGGSLGVTTTSGPGIALKSEAIGLAVMSELPLVVIDVQRGGPSTGLPTKTEQADLLQAMYGRNGESPVPVLAPRSPGDCFDTVLDAVRIALRYRTRVLLLSDGAIATGSEPWLIPSVEELPDL